MASYPSFLLLVFPTNDGCYQHNWIVKAYVLRFNVKHNTIIKVCVREREGGRRGREREGGRKEGRKL